MFAKTTLIKRLLLPATLCLLAVVSFCVRLADISLIDLMSGFSHPLEGWDHLITMLGVGIWAAQLRGKAIWLLPLTFVSVMSLGGISGAASYLVVPSAEVLILLSCLVFSALIIRKIRFNTKVNVLIVAFFAFFHGYAHGQEISTSASLISYTLGFMVATLLLHGAGILLARLVLIVFTLFISHALHAAEAVELVKQTTISHSVVSYQVDKTNVSDFFAQQINKEQRTQTKKPPPIIMVQWLNLIPPIKAVWCCSKISVAWAIDLPAMNASLCHLASGVGLTSPPAAVQYYFIFASLLVVFLVPHNFCYVFYPKQHQSYCLALARCVNKSKKSVALFLTLWRLLFYSLFSFSIKDCFLVSKQGVVSPFENAISSKLTGASMKTYLSKFTVLFLITLTPNFAHAHSMQMTAVDWLNGFIHPLQGLDHIVAMLAVGVWAMQLRGHALWLLPLTFISVMGLGGLLGMTGLAVSSAELIILLSGLVLSVLAVKKVQFSLKINVLIVAFFAFFHGYAHGYELTDSADFLSYSLGFMVATALLHGIGMMLGSLVQAALHIRKAVRL